MAANKNDTTQGEAPLRKRQCATEIGRRIDSLLRVQGKARSELARACGEIPESFNKKLVNGTIRAERIPALAQFLDVSIEFLLTGRDDQTQVLAASLFALYTRLETAIAADAVQSFATTLVEAHDTIAEAHEQVSGLILRAERQAMVEAAEEEEGEPPGPQSHDPTTTPDGPSTVPGGSPPAS